MYCTNMKNPLKKFREEILTEIKVETELLKENFNLLTEKLEVYEKTISEYQEKFDILFNFFTAEEEQPTAAEIEQQQKEAQEQMTAVIQNAFVNMVNKPENQKAINDFVNSILSQATGGAMGGPAIGGWDQLTNEDGSLNIGFAIGKFLESRTPGRTQLVGQPVSGRSGKSTGY